MDPGLGGQPGSPSGLSPPTPAAGVRAAWVDIRGHGAHVRGMMTHTTPETPTAEDREEALDEALEETFPASDPPAITAPRPHPHRDPAQEELREP